MLAHLTVPEFIDFGHKAIEEVTVVADTDEGTVKILKCLFKDIFCLEVEVIGGLVENKQIHRFEQ